MAFMNLAATLSSAFLAAISASSTARSSSGSVPSMPICRPRFRNGSSMLLTWASRASRPSLRAFSARVTRVWIWSVAGGTLAGITAILNQAGIFLRSSMVWLDIAAPNVAMRTSTIAGRKISDVGSEPSMTMKPRRAAIETTKPMSVTGSTGSAFLSGRERHDGRSAVGYRRHGGGVLAAVHLVAGGEDRRAVLADLLEHLVHALLDDVLGAVHEEGDRVGVALDPLDQVGVEREPLTVQAGHTDHGGSSGLLGRGASVRTLCTVHIGATGASLEPNGAPHQA